jgi:RNA polymerase subunit RPABC4/transcription elongation factor Spt4
MSLHRLENIPCPNCQQVQEATVWQSLNVSIDPEEKQKLFAGEINTFKCGKCEYTELIDVPFDYHDMGLKFYVRYIPFDSLKDGSILNSFSENGFPSPEDYEHLEVPDYMRTMHIVFHMGELVRYVFFREALAEQQ